MFRLQDLRYAFRLLLRAPGFTLLTVLVLAGGLGLSIFTFSFLHTAMLKPIPVEDGERVVRLTATVEGRTLGSIDAADVAEFRPRVTTLEDLGVYTMQELVVGSGEATRTIHAAATEWNLFRMTRANAAMGRTFVPEDQLPGAEPVAVLSDATWRAVFGGDPRVLDSVVRLSGVPTRVVGIMPKGFGFPVASDAWVPIAPAVLAQSVPDRDWVMAYARLAPGRSMAEASAELTTLYRQVRATRPAVEGRAAPDGMKTISYPLAQIGDEAPLVLGVLNGLATLILLLACINVTTLLVARAEERARETAVRLALGAPRGRLVMQSLWEVILLASLGGLVAVGFATWLLDAVNAWAQGRLEGNLAFWWRWGFDQSVVLGGGGFVALAVLVLGIVASRRAVHTEINAVLQEHGHRGGGRRQGRVARLLVTAQVATVSLLLFCGVLSAVVAWRVIHLDLGYDTTRLLQSSVGLPDERYPDQAARARAFDALQAGLTARPELEGAVLRRTLADNTSDRGRYQLPGATGAARDPRSYVVAIAGPLTTLGAPLVEGRFFGTADGAGAAPVALVSRAFAAREWPGQSPLGRQVKLTGLGEDQPSRTVTGVVEDLLYGNPLSRDRSAVAVYVPLAQVDVADAAILFRHRGSEPAARSAFHAVLQQVDPTLSASYVQSFAEILAKGTAMAESVMLLFGGAFAFALLLAVSGTYGLMAWSIGRRTRELGVRRALGATDRSILWLLLGQGARQLGIGAVVALPLTVGVAVVFARYFPVSVAYSVGLAVLVSAFVVGGVLAATWVPTRRAVAVGIRDALWSDT